MGGHVAIAQWVKEFLNKYFKSAEKKDNRVIIVKRSADQENSTIISTNNTINGIKTTITNGARELMDSISNNNYSEVSTWVLMMGCLLLFISIILIIYFIAITLYNNILKEKQLKNKQKEIKEDNDYNDDEGGFVSIPI